MKILSGKRLSLSRPLFRHQESVFDPNDAFTGDDEFGLQGEGYAWSKDRVNAATDQWQFVQLKAHTVPHKRDRVRMPHEPLCTAVCFHNPKRQIIEVARPDAGSCLPHDGLLDLQRHVVCLAQLPLERTSSISFFITSRRFI